MGGQNPPPPKCKSEQHEHESVSRQQTTITKALPACNWPVSTQIHLFRSFWNKFFLLEGSAYTISNIPMFENPSCLQTTEASLLSHKSSHTVPHNPPKQISTLPSYTLAPSTNRTSPSKHIPVTDQQPEWLYWVLFLQSSISSYRTDFWQIWNNADVHVRGSATPSFAPA